MSAVIIQFPRTSIVRGKLTQRAISAQYAKARKQYPGDRKKAWDAAVQVADGGACAPVNKERRHD
jgi:hypothetical protein